MGKGLFDLIARALSLIVLILLSVSGTCSVVTTTLRWIPTVESMNLNDSNWLSIRIVLTLNPLNSYISFICTIALKIVSVCMFFRWHTIPNFMFLETVTRKGSVFTNMTPPPRVIFLYISSISLGRLLIYVGTCSILHRLVFPLMQSKLGPNIVSAAIISSLVTGKFGMKLFSYALMNIWREGCPTDAWNFIFLAALYCLLVYGSLFVYTVDSSIFQKVLHYFGMFSPTLLHYEHGWRYLYQYSRACWWLFEHYLVSSFVYYKNIILPDVIHHRVELFHLGRW